MARIWIGGAELGVGGQDAYSIVSNCTAELSTEISGAYIYRTQTLSNGYLQKSFVSSYSEIYVSTPS